jgi:hypothetical protein
MRDLVYPATLQPESHGAFTVRFPDFPEAITSGRNHADALTEAEDCCKRRSPAAWSGRKVSRLRRA